MLLERDPRLEVGRLTGDVLFKYQPLKPDRDPLLGIDINQLLVAVE